MLVRYHIAGGLADSGKMIGNFCSLFSKLFIRWLYYFQNEKS